MIINMHWSSRKVKTTAHLFTNSLIIFQILMKLNFLDRFSENTKIKFHENPSSWIRVVSCGRTDGPLD